MKIGDKVLHLFRVCTVHKKKGPYAYVIDEHGLDHVVNMTRFVLNGDMWEEQPDSKLVKRSGRY